MQLSWSKKKNILYSLGVILLTIIVLFDMGRIAFCKCGIISLWSGDITSSQQSQQFSDPYTFTHFEHGIIIYFILWFFFKKKLSPIQRLLFAVGLESAWEIVENTDYIINRYREATISLDYFGDSIFNSVSDIFAMVVGFMAAWKLPAKVSVAMVVLVELLLLYFIRDDLLINIIMLIHPVDAIKNWQSM